MTIIIFVFFWFLFIYSSSKRGFQPLSDRNLLKSNHGATATPKFKKIKNMTQRDLARKLGKSEAVVSRWITGFPNLRFVPCHSFQRLSGNLLSKWRKSISSYNTRKPSRVMPSSESTMQFMNHPVNGIINKCMCDIHASFL